MNCAADIAGVDLALGFDEKDSCGPRGYAGSMRLSFAILLAIISLGIDCSSGGDGSNSSSASLDCAWLAGNNCWKSTLSQAESCLPPKSETGTLSADMKTCTYVSGAVVTFDSALVLPAPDDLIWSFTVTSGGQPCLRYQDTSGSAFSLTINGQTFTESAEGLALAVTCPDHTTFSSSNPLELFSCPADGGAFGGLPGKAWFDTSTSISFSFIGTALGSATIFSCRTP